MHPLYVAATPIGNLEDITVRAIKKLLTVNKIWCEDTRRTGQLVKILWDRYPQWRGRTTEKIRLESVRDFNEESKIEKLLADLETEDIVLVSDAGTPLLSDPGFKLVRAVRAAGGQIIPLPGAYAGATAASVMGLPTNKLMFWGFWNGKEKLIPGCTNIIYESPQRVVQTIQKIKEDYPGAEIRVARELTKVHEIICDDKSLPQSEKIKGEITLGVYYS